MAKVYGERPPWHDAQLEIRGPAVADVETVFRERWEDPTPITSDPLRRLADLIRRDDEKPGPLPPQAPDPPVAGTAAVQLLRTYPARRRGFSFAPEGEHSVALGYLKVLDRAQHLVYLEDQYLWSADVGDAFARALRQRPGLRLIAVVPRFPDQDGAISEPPNLVGREDALRALRDAGGDRVAVYSIENEDGVPIYVHAKVCVVDDRWAAIGSDNFNRRSWTYDSELSAAVVDEAPAPADGGFPRRLRLTLAAEHLGRDESDVADLAEPSGAFDAFARSAAALEAWHANGRTGPRPAGQLRPALRPSVGRWKRLWAAPLYRALYDPDGRSRALRRRDAY
jgi:phosphatidylserine/phosphatidylglycerophosphate/cardiolipin synthase-like enzyme